MAQNVSNNEISFKKERERERNTGTEIDKELKLEVKEVKKESLHG